MSDSWLVCKTCHDFRVRKGGKSVCQKQGKIVRFSTILQIENFWQIVRKITLTTSDTISMIVCGVLVRRYVYVCRMASQTGILLTVLLAVVYRIVLLYER